MSSEALPTKASWRTRTRSIAEKIGMSFAACFAWTVLWCAILSGTMGLMVPAPADPLYPTTGEIRMAKRVAKPLAALGMLLGGGGYFIIATFITRRPHLKH